MTHINYTKKILNIKDKNIYFQVKDMKNYL